MMRQSFKKLVFPILASTIIVVSFSACSKSDDDDTTVTASTGVSGVISANHGHVVIISPAQLSAGTALSLQFTGTADHTHSISLTSAELTTIKSGGTVSKESTVTSSHSHTVKFN